MTTNDSGRPLQRLTRDFAFIVFGAALVLIVLYVRPAEVRAWLIRAMARAADGIVLLVPAVLGIVLLSHEGRMKRKQHTAELEIRRQEIEDSQKQWNEERQFRKAQREALQEESENLRGLTSRLARTISDHMAADTRWASEAMERAKLGAFGKTLFGERVGHFYDEKEFLAEHFIELLINRCRWLIHDGKRVCVLIDSGTTLHPLFRHLGEKAVAIRQNEETWINGLTVVTNNLPGIETLMDVGRLNPNDRYSSLAIACRLLPGVPLPVYSAVTGKLAIKALNELRDEQEHEEPKGNFYFVALVTGNWIRVRRTEPACPIPLARGEGHKDFKQALVDMAAETYVVTPLGKIFTRAPLAEVNAALGFDKNHAARAKQPYEELEINAEKALTMKLVTTSRTANRVLYKLSVRVQSDLGSDDREDFVTASAQDVPHLYFPFDEKLPKAWHEEILTEFPHPSTRKPAIRQKYFLVPSQPARPD